jgi:hypothetical protein
MERIELKQSPPKSTVSGLFAPRSNLTIFLESLGYTVSRGQ